MAGQPQDPSFSSAAEEPGLTQGRPTWQPGYDPHVSVPPASTPPPGGASGGGGGGGGQAYAAPPPAYGDPGYSGPGGHDQTFAGQPNPAYRGGHQADYQADYQARAGQYHYGDPGQQQSGGTPPPQWNAGPDSAAATPGTRSSERGEKGFLGSLFDFSFTSLVTPKIIRVLFVLITLWTALVALIIAIIGFRTGGVGGGLVVLIVIVPIFVLLTLGIYRVVLEAFMVVFRIYEELKRLRENSERASAD